MADSTIDSEDFVLSAAGWGVFPADNDNVPKDGFTGSEHHNVALASKQFPLGMMKQVYCKGDTGLEGFAQFMYLLVGTQNADVAIAAKTFCVPDAADNPYEVTNDPDDCIFLPAHCVAVALSAMTDAYCGWFWVGGVCPEQYVSDLGGNYVTDGNVAAGMVVAHDLSADKIGLAPVLGTETAGDIQEMVVGWATAADA